MQIHELNQSRKSNITEVDLVGPGGIFDVAKQVIKDPRALGSASALGSAEQDAAQASATKSAQKLAAQGYQVGGSAKPVVTTAQQLQKVKSNPAVQQQVKNLASQWMTQSAALKKSKPVTEAVAEFNPRDLADPKYASVLKAIQARDAAAAAAKPTAPAGGPPGKSMPVQPYQAPGAGTSAVPATAAGYQTPAKAAVDANVTLQKNLTTWKNQFLQWSDQKLATQGVTMDQVRRDTVTADALDKAMANVAVAAQSGNPNLENEAVSEYLNLAIAGIQAYVNNSQTRTASSEAPAATPTAGQPTDQQQIKQQLDKIGITKTQLEALGKAFAQANRGSAVINNTGNSLLNNILKMTGMTVR